MEQDKEVKVLAPYKTLVHNGIFSAPEFKDCTYNFGHASLPAARGGTGRRNIEYLVPQRTTYLACPKSVHSCRGRFVGYKYLLHRGVAISDGNGGPRALYRCKHGLGYRPLMFALSREHPIKKFSWRI